jgi:hypothetical protein
MSSTDCFCVVFVGTAVSNNFPFQILDEKVSSKKVFESKVGSLANVKHRPGGGDKLVFNDKEYLRQMSETTGAQLMAKSMSGPSSRDGSRRESAVQVCADFKSMALSFKNGPHMGLRP